MTSARNRLGDDRPAALGERSVAFVNEREGDLDDRRALDPAAVSISPLRLEQHTLRKLLLGTKRHVTGGQWKDDACSA